MRKSEEDTMILEGKRILIIAEDLEPGGARVVLERVIHFFAALDCECICITGNATGRIAHEMGVQIDPGAAKGGWGLKGRIAEIPQARRILQNYRPDLIIIHASSPGYMYALMFFRTPVLYHLHTLIEERRNWTRHLVYPHIREMDKHIIAVSEWHKANICSQWGLKERFVTVLPNYPDRKVNMRDRRDIILTAGRFHWSKNPTLWREVGESLNELLEVRNMFMVWCAPRIDEMEMRFRNSLPSRLQLIEIRDQAELNEYFSRAALYYQPSLVEPQGIAVLEAMQNGIPCLVTENTGMLDAIRHEETGIVLPKSGAEVHRAALASLLQDSVRAKRYGDCGRREVLDRYTPTNWAIQYRGIIQSICQSETRL